MTTRGGRPIRITLIASPCREPFTSSAARALAWSNRLVPPAV